MRTGRHWFGTLHPRHPLGQSSNEAAHGSTCGDQAYDWKTSCPSVSQRNCSHHLDLCCGLWAGSSCLPRSPHPVQLNRHSSRHDLSSSAQVPKPSWHLPPTNLPAWCLKFRGWYLLLPLGTFENLALKHILKLKFFLVSRYHTISPMPAILWFLPEEGLTLD